MVLQFDPTKERLPLIKTRDQWGAKEPIGAVEKLETPAEFLFLTYAGAVGSCSNEKECIKAMQALQQFHMDHGQPDVPYNFLIGGDKQIYEGRGWFQSCHPPPARTDLYGKCYVFAFLGPLRDLIKACGPPNMKSLSGVIQLVQFGQDVNNIREDVWDWQCKVRDWNVYDN